MSGINVNPQTLARIKRYLDDPAYKDAIEHSATYNTRLCIERKMRLPFLDAQTGVAQNNCYLWMSRRQRMPGENHGQLYMYPSKRWRKRRRQYLVNFLRPRARDLDLHETDVHQISTVENPAAKMEDDGKEEKVAEDSKDSWYKDFDDSVDPPDAADVDDPESDYDDYEETYTKRKKRKAPQRGKKKDTKYDPLSEVEKPYQCDYCGARYKTRPGLSYHYSHSHTNPTTASATTSTVTAATVTTAPIAAVMAPATVAAIATNTNTSTNTNNISNSNIITSGIISTNNTTAATAITTASTSNTPTINTNINNNNSGSADRVEDETAAPSPPKPSTSTAADPLAGLKKFQDSFLSFLKHPGQKPPNANCGNSKGPTTSPSPYCDFCLGDATENKKTKQAEELVSCSDCGRSGHPSCLQFTPNMMISVKKYRWQCIECKCCTICGTSDNDDQLLFCDDCDRGYHMYCLDPPLSEPPEGSWSCHLCIEEFHKK
jgi:zinc finger protein ubi-d4